MPVAGPRLGAAAGERGLGDAVLEAEVVAAFVQRLRELLVDDRKRLAGRVERLLQARAGLSSRAWSSA